MGLILFLVLLINYYHFNCDYNMLDFAHTTRAWNASSLRKLILCLQKRKGMKKKKQSSHWGGNKPNVLNSSFHSQQYIPIMIMTMEIETHNLTWYDTMPFDAMPFNSLSSWNDVQLHIELACRFQWGIDERETCLPG